MDKEKQAICEIKRYRKEANAKASIRKAYRRSAKKAGRAVAEKQINETA